MSRTRTLDRVALEAGAATANSFQMGHHQESRRRVTFSETPVFLWEIRTEISVSKALSMFELCRVSFPY